MYVAMPWKSRLVLLTDQSRLKSICNTSHRELPLDNLSQTVGLVENKKNDYTLNMSFLCDHFGTHTQL